MPYHQRMTKRALRAAIKRAAPPKKRADPARTNSASGYRIGKSVDDKPRVR